MLKPEERTEREWEEEGAARGERGGGGEKTETMLNESFFLAFFSFKIFYSRFHSLSLSGSPRQHTKLSFKNFFKFLAQSRQGKRKG